MPTHLLLDTYIITNLFYHHALYSTLWLLVTRAMSHCPDLNMLLWTISCTCGVGGMGGWARSEEKSQKLSKHVEVFDISMELWLISMHKV